MPSDSPWQPVLEKHCCQSVRDEFLALGASARAQMLAALAASANDTVERVIQKSIESAYEGASDKDAEVLVKQMMQRKAAPVPEAYHTLVDAFRSRGVQVDRVPDMEAICRTLATEALPQWGLPLPRASLLAGLRFHHAQRKELQVKLRQDPEQRQMLRTSSGVRKEVCGSGGTRWRDLRPTPIRDLRLFEPLAGTRLDGVLVVMPTLTVGVLTALEDSTGQAIQLGLYNLPGATAESGGQEFVEKLLPQGRRITLVEPFLKIMVDGNRGIRMDNPSDVIIHEDAQHRRPLEEVKREGKEAFGGGNFEAAAIKWEEVLASDDVNGVHVLLSNRAQAHLAQEGRHHAAGALRDAAAALILRPGSQKAQLRLLMALGRLAPPSVVAWAERCLQQPAGQSAAEGPPPADPDEECVLAPDEFLASILEATPPSAVGEAGLRAGREAAPSEQRPDADEQRALGNEAYKAGRLDEAVRAYTSGLASPLATLVTQVLSNLSAAALKMQRPQSAVAFAAAALRVASGAGESEKPTFRLGQALVSLRCFRAASVVLQWSAAQECSALAGDIEGCARRARGGCSTEEALAGSGPASCVEFCGPAQAVLIEGKGRGLRATRAVAFGECILINRALVSAVVDERREGTFHQLKGNSYTDSSQSKAACALLRSAATDLALRRRLEMLCDGSGRSPSLVPAGALLQRLDLVCAPPFVPPEARYLGAAAQGLSAARAEKILYINCHGGVLPGLQKPRNLAELDRYFEESARPGRPKAELALKNTALYPAVALLNHSSDPNTLLIPIGPDAVSITAVFASRDIEEGEEITITYGADPETLRSKWGIGRS